MLRTPALRAVLASATLVAVAGAMGACVRLLPWLLDPAVPWRVAAPFARVLAASALEIALVVGWPVGWAVAVSRFVTRGEARAVASLGESPARTLMRLIPQGVIFALCVGAVSTYEGLLAREPGRVAADLVTTSRASCARTDAPRAFTVPFVNATWLCHPSSAPVIAGHGPGALSRTLYTAKSAELGSDLRELTLTDAWVLAPFGGERVRLHVATFSLTGLGAWGSAVSSSAQARGFLLALGAAVAAWTGAALCLVGLRFRRARVRYRAAENRSGWLRAVALGAAGPVAALVLLRVTERIALSLWIVGPLTLLVTFGGALIVAALFAWLAPAE